MPIHKKLISDHAVINVIVIRFFVEAIYSTTQYHLIDGIFLLEYYIIHMIEILNN